MDKGLFLDGVVSGSGNLTINHQYGGTSSWHTSIVYFNNNANTYSGTVTVTPGATGSGGNFVALGGNGIDGSSALANATVHLAGSNPSNDRFGSSMLVFTTDLPEAATIGALSGSDNVVLTEYDMNAHVYGANSVALTVGGNDSSTEYSGEISGGGSLTKTGSGTLELSGTSTYTGSTNVDSGSLFISGALGNTAVTVDAGAAIGGDGLIGGSLDFASGANLLFSLTNTLSVTGDVTFGGFAILNLIGLNSEIADGTYTLIDGAVDFTNISNVGVANAYNLGDGKSAYFEQGSLNVVVIPEPGAALLGGISVLALLRRRRK